MADQRQNGIDLVTGAAGFVGGRLVAELLGRGRRVRAGAMAGDPLREAVAAGLSASASLEWCDLDVTDPASVRAAVEGVDRVYHAAGLVSAFAPPEAFERVNVEGTRNICRAARDCGVGRLVAVSTSDVFGLPETGGECWNEESPWREWGEPYPDTKIAAARVVAAARAAGLEASLVYPGWVYGPGDRAFLPSVIEMVRSGMALVWGDGAAFEVSFVHVDDLVRGIAEAGANPRAAGEDFLFLDDASGVTTVDFYGKLAALLGCTVRVRHLPYFVVDAAARVSQWATRRGLLREPFLRTNDVKSFGYAFRFSAAKARRLLDWEPRFGTDEGLADAVAWFLEHIDRPA
jgi:nucleoside-diphosphate-sugar epimerase